MTDETPATPATPATSLVPAEPAAAAATPATSVVPAEPAAVASTPWVAPAAPPRRKRGILIGAIVGGAVLLLGGGLAVTYAVLAAQHAPAQQLTHFLQSLVDGDSPAAQEFLLEAPADVPDLLTEDIYAAASDRIEKFEVIETVIDGKTATVTAAITQAGATSTQEFILKTAGRDLVFDVWGVDRSNLPTVTVQFERPAEGMLAVNGVTAEKYDGITSPALHLFPGTYEFAATEMPAYLQTEGTEVLATFAGQNVNTGAALKTSLSEAGIATARAAVDGHINWCLSQAVPDVLCGYSIIPDDATYTNIRWSMTLAPTYEFGEWVDESAYVEVTVPGSIREDSDYSRPNGEYGTAYAVFDDYEPYGYVTFNADGTAVFESLYVE